MKSLTATLVILLHITWIRNTDSCSYSLWTTAFPTNQLFFEKSYFWFPHLKPVSCCPLWPYIKCSWCSVTVETTRISAAAFLLHLTSLHCLPGADWVSLTPAENLFAPSNAFWHVLRPASWRRRGRKLACKIESNERPSLLFYTCLCTE